MLVRLGKCLMFLSLAALPLSCTEMPEWAATGEGGVGVEELPYEDAIPLDWGQLVSVTLIDENNRHQLWFQDEEGTIRMVGYNLRTNEFQPDIRAFPRN